MLPLVIGVGKDEFYAASDVTAFFSNTKKVVFLEDSELADLVKFSKPIAKQLKTALNPKTGKVGMMVAGLEVSHTHIHLIPMDSEADLNFANAKSAGQEELQNILEKISSQSSS